MYSYLIKRMRNVHGYITKPADLWPDAVIRRALEDAPFPLDYALRIQREFFPGESLQELFRQDDTNGITDLTCAEAINIIHHTFPCSVMPDDVFIACYIAFPEDWKRYWVMTVGGGYALGYAAGLRNLRAHAKKRQEWF